MLRNMYSPAVMGAGSVAHRPGQHVPKRHERVHGPRFRFQGLGFRVEGTLSIRAESRKLSSG